ncbi:TOPRIM nucleotidyl transferase/hydrolase domain-containing protein [Mycetocola zhadangensis]|uniref:ATP-dependent endonuclease n=1 Tax=Mycetocola zhadangensis TaxID=1164595 RepID=A0A3L7J0M9_9MICO|nr:TOPRIM nucleotidyl transferase/hydrolase domain-containing protein [Mycetocola zhadangensis]RLQ83997.1 ATP-dependent endonuclease [Mycetocola zhadangensis]GGE96997.1 hypothetical protein GCM10011313_20060 [Mycetocola zhadangensis]
MDDLADFRNAVQTWVTGPTESMPSGLSKRADDVALVVLVEGDSDRVAIEALAEARGRDLESERVVLLPIGGAMNIRAYLSRLGPAGLGMDVAGLCDANELGYFRRAMEHSGLGAELDVSGMEELGFFSCDADLEDELIRALGIDGVERALAAEGDLRAFRTFQNQPAQRGRETPAQLRRFLGTIGGRKSRYARVLTGALGSAPAPRPLERLLEYTAS